MTEKKSKEETVVCPVGTFFTDLERAFGRRSQFFEHMTRSRIEFLKGIKSLLDDRIENLEKRASQSGGKKMTKIEVE